MYCIFCIHGVFDASILLFSLVCYWYYWCSSKLEESHWYDFVSCGHVCVDVLLTTWVCLRRMRLFSLVCNLLVGCMLVGVGWKGNQHFGALSPLSVL